MEPSTNIMGHKLNTGILCSIYVAEESSAYQNRLRGRVVKGVAHLDHV